MSGLFEVEKERTKNLALYWSMQSTQVESKLFHVLSMVEDWSETLSCDAELEMKGCPSRRGRNNLQLGNTPRAPQTRRNICSCTRSEGSRLLPAQFVHIAGSMFTDDDITPHTTLVLVYHRFN